MQSIMTQKQRLKRRANLLYRIRKKNIRVNTRTQTIYTVYGEPVPDIARIRPLTQEYHFVIQPLIT